MRIFVNDTFSGQVDNDNLTDHTGEVGASWTAQLGNPTFAKMTAAGRVWPNGFDFFLASGLPTKPDYSVIATAFQLSAHAGETVRLLARFIAGNPANGYLARFVASTAQVGIFKIVAGVSTQLGSLATVTLPTIGGAGKQMEFRLLGSRLKLIYDGVEVVSVTDTSYTDAGRVGLGTNGATGPAAGLQWGDFLAQESGGRGFSFSLPFGV